MSRSGAGAAGLALVTLYCVTGDPPAIAGDPHGEDAGVADDAVVPVRHWDARDPFQTEARRVLVGRPLPDPQQAPTTLPIRDVTGVSYYTDASHSISDPALKKRNEAVLKPLRGYVKRVVELADGWAESQPAKPAYAVLMVDALATWARADALLGAVNQQGEYEREWTLSSLALAYLRVRAAPGLDRAKCRSIETWLGRVARAIRPFYDQPGRLSSVNNHACWAGLAVAAGGIAARDRELFDWGVLQGRIGFAQIRPDGFLPLELRRKTLALHYHVFALAPLVMLAELAEANGVPLDRGEGGLRKLTDRVIDGLRDPGVFAAAAGAPQQISLPPRGTDLAWAEIDYAHSRDPRLRAWLAAARPLHDDRLGGDLTATFGVPDLK